MNMTQLAGIAGVSVSTISKAFSGSPEISQEKREQIFTIAKKYGCYDKYCKEKYSGTVIAVICPEYKSGLYSQQLSFLEKYIREKNALMISASTDFNSQRLDELLTFFTEYSKVDGLILFSDPKTDNKLSIPVVVLGDSEFFDNVRVAGEKAFIQAIGHLKKNGHRNIAYIGEPLTIPKKNNFIKAMENNKLPIHNDYIVTVERRFEECGYNAMEKLLRMEIPPTAVLAAYDDIAYGAMKCIYEHGLKIPDDISLIGCDDNRNSSYLNVSLTTITEYNEDLCQILVELLFDRIKNPGKKKTINITKDLVIRESVGKANPNYKGNILN